MADIRIKKIRLGAPSASISTNFKVIKTGSEPEPQPSGLIGQAALICSEMPPSIFGNAEMEEL